MEITLNKANKLRNSLSQMRDRIPLQASIFSNNEMKEQFDSAQEEFTQKVQTQLSVYDAERDIRKIISTVNHESGISDIIADIATLNKVISFLSSISIQGTQVGDVILQRKAEIGNAEKLGTPQPIPRRVNVSILDEEAEKRKDEDLKKQKKSLDDLTEKRNALNHSVKVTLPDPLVKFLRELNLL